MNLKSPGTRKFSDIRNDFMVHPTTKDLVLRTAEDSVKQSVKNLILLGRHEKPFHPEISSGIQQYLFDPMNDVSVKLIEKSVETIIQKYEPRVDLVGVVAEPDYDRNSYRMVIVYRIKNSPQPVATQELDFFMERLR